MFKTLKQRAEEAVEVERAVYSAVETGNLDQARTILIEYSEVNYFAMQEIGKGVAITYGITL